MLMPFLYLKNGESLLIMLCKIVLYLVGKTVAKSQHFFSHHVTYVSQNYRGCGCVAFMRIGCDVVQICVRGILGISDVLVSSPSAQCTVA